MSYQNSLNIWISTFLTSIKSFEISTSYKKHLLMRKWKNRLIIIMRNFFIFKKKKEKKRGNHRYVNISNNLIQQKCTYGGLTLDVDRHYIECHSNNTPGKRHNNTWVESLAGNCTTSSTRQRQQVWQKCKIQKNWCTVTVAPTIEHHGGHSRAPANQRWDQVPGRSQRLLLG